MNSNRASMFIGWAAHVSLVCFVAAALPDSTYAQADGDMPSTSESSILNSDGMNELTDASVGTSNLPNAAVASASGWTTYQGNASHTGYVSGTQNPATFSQLWSVQQDFADATDKLRPVAAADGMVYMVKQTYAYTDGEIWARDAKTGAIVWHATMPNQTFESAPAFGDGAVYVDAGGYTGTTLNSPTVYAFGSADGSLLWSQGARRTDLLARPADHLQRQRLHGQRLLRRHDRL